MARFALARIPASKACLTISVRSSLAIAPSGVVVLKIAEPMSTALSSTFTILRKSVSSRAGVAPLRRNPLNVCDSFHAFSVVSRGISRLRLMSMFPSSCQNAIGIAKSKWRVPRVVTLPLLLSEPPVLRTVIVLEFWARRMSPVTDTVMVSVPNSMLRARATAPPILFSQVRLSPKGFKVAS